jgi:hypothetical protein
MEHEKKGRESVSWRKKENGNTEGWVGSVPPTQHQGAPDVPCVTHEPPLHANHVTDAWVNSSLDPITHV